MVRASNAASPSRLQKGGSYIVNACTKGDESIPEKIFSRYLTFNIGGMQNMCQTCMIGNPYSHGGLNFG